MPESPRPDLLAGMYPAQLPWVFTDNGAQVAVGQLGLLIVRKIGISFEIAVFGKALKERSVTIDEGKERAEMAARRWIAQAAAMLWSKEAPVVLPPTLSHAHAGGTMRRAKEPKPG